MPGVGVGGLISNFLNPGMNDQVARVMTPNAAPLAQQAAPDGQAGANMTPSVAPAPDPVNSQYIGTLLKASQQAAYAADLNRNFAGIAAGFGTAQQQHDKQAALGGEGGGATDYLGQLKTMQGMQENTIAENEHARFMGNAAIFAQTLSTQLGRPVSVAEATEIMNNPDLMKQIGGAAAANAETTTTEKDAEAATRAYAAAHPEATAKDIADYKANLIAGGMGGSDLEQRQYLQEKANGVTTDDFATWKAKKAAQATTLTQQAKDSQEFKDTATQDYTSVSSKLRSVQDAIDTLERDPAAAQAAMKSFQPTTGKWAAIDPFQPQNIKDAAAALQKVQSSLSADQLANVKNVRNQREFGTLSQAANAGLQAASSPEDFKKGLDDIRNKYLDAQATAELSVGHKLTGKLVGHGNSDLLSPTLSNGQPNPYYNGGSEDGQPLKGDDLAKVTQALADHPEKREQILDQVRKNGYSPRGLL